MKAEYYYQVHPTSYPLLKNGEQNALVDGFKKLLNALNNWIKIIIRKEVKEVELEDKIIPTTIYSFYIISRERIDRLLDRAGLRYNALLDPPPQLLDPRTCIVKPNYIVQSGKVLKVLTVYGFPPVLREGFLHEIYPFTDELRILIAPIPTYMAYHILRGKLKLLRALMASYNVEGKTPDTLVMESFEKTSRLLDEVMRREVKLFLFKSAFVVSASSIVEAREKADILKKTLESYGFEVDSPKYMHWLIYELKEPTGLYVDTHTLGAWFPFISTTLTEVEGIFLGRSRLDNSPVFLDVWSHKSYNVSVLGMMGTGKSAFAKKMLYEYSYKFPEDRLHFYVIDRTGEYIPLLKALGAQIIEIKRGKELGFDPFKLLPPEHASSFLASQLELDPKKFMELQKLAAKYDSFSKVHSEASSELKEMLSGLIEGPLGWIFRGKSINLTTRVGVVLRDLGSPEAEGLIGALFLLSFIQRIRNTPVNIRKIIVLDEFMQIIEAFKAYDVASWLLMFFKNTRKWFVSVIYIAHDPREIVESKSGRIIAGQLSAIKLLFQHDIDAARASTELFSLGPVEAETIINANVGECLLLAENIRIPVRIELSRKEAELFETRPYRLS